MADPVSARSLAAALAFLALAAGANAQSLPDPTRPPAHARETAVAAGAGAAAPAGLQSIMIAGGRRSALIDGRQVRVGGKVGTARIARIDETGVVLRNADGSTETLRLYPDGTMKPHAQASPAGRRVAGRTQKKR